MELDNSCILSIFLIYFFIGISHDIVDVVLTQLVWFGDASTPIFGPFRDPSEVAKVAVLSTDVQNLMKLWSIDYLFLNQPKLRWLYLFLSVLTCFYRKTKQIYWVIMGAGFVLLIGEVLHMIYIFLPIILGFSTNFWYYYSPNSESPNASLQYTIMAIDSVVIIILVLLLIVLLTCMGILYKPKPKTNIIEVKREVY